MHLAFGGTLDWRCHFKLEQSRFYHCQTSTAHTWRIKVDGSVATISIKISLSTYMWCIFTFWTCLVHVYAVTTATVGWRKVDEHDTVTGILQNLVPLNANINRTTSISSMANNKAILHIQIYIICVQETVSSLSLFTVTKHISKMQCHY
jgi:hypothetical protein